jgi:M6 family metalloprotease-like protein
MLSKSDWPKFSFWKRKSFAFIVLVPLVGYSLACPAFGAAKAGASCTKAGITSTVSGKKFTCVKSGKKLVWDAGTSMALSTSKPTELTKPNSSDSNQTKLNLAIGQACDSVDQKATLAEVKYICGHDFSTLNVWEAICGQVGDTGWHIDGVAGKCTATGSGTPIWVFPNIDSIVSLSNRKSPIPDSTQSPKPIATPAPVIQVEVPTPPLSPKSNLIPVEQCEISPTIFHSPPFDLGFKRNTTWASSKGTLNIAVLFLSYQDAQLNPLAVTEYESVQEKKAMEFFSTSSYGKMRLNFVNSTKIYSVPNSTANYHLDSENADNTAMYQDAMKVGSSEFDFTKFDELLLVVPDEIVAKDLGPAYGFQAKYGNAIIRLGVAGAYNNPSNHRLVNSGYVTHEIGHTFGLTHPYAGVFGIWDVMEYDNTFAPDLFSWEKFILGWITPQQVDCLSSTSTQEVTAYLEAVEIASDETKFAMIRLSNTQAIIVESRRKSALDLIDSSQEGVVVYKLDLNLGFDQGVISLVGNQIRNIQYEGHGLFSSSLQQGESVLIEGLKISVLKHAISGDYVSIVKAS